MKNTIILKGHGITQERKAVAAITPGHLIEEAATGFQKHSTAGGSAEKLFAIEDDNQGNDIDDDYVTGGLVFAKACTAGMEVMAILAEGENAAIGSKLESNGDGTLRVVDTDTSAATIEVGSIVATAVEALDMSDSSLADPASARLAVRLW